MILWEGESQIDGSPIMAIATMDTSNTKTGDMIQVWILRQDLEPHTAAKLGKDRGVCGDCPQRHYLGGACYVTLHQAPLAVHRRYASGGYHADEKHNRRVAAALKVKPIRMGAYGDPAAVPFYVWEALIAEGCGKWTGYTHQWRKRWARPYRALLMASCDTEAEAIEARARGWRFFLVTPEAPTPTLDRVVECLSDARQLTCEECRICDGTRAGSHPGAASVAIQVHGAKAKRFLSVIQ